MESDHRSRAVRRDTLNTVSLVEPWIHDNDSVIDIGCGEGWVLWELLKRRQLARVVGVDVTDMRCVHLPSFMLFDGHRIPVEDKSVDVAMLNFVLHHVPNEEKDRLLLEVSRIARGFVVVLEDTPVTFFDRYLARRHGEDFRKRVGSKASYGFLAKEEWEAKFGDLGFALEHSSRLGRLDRNWRQPYARSVFVLSPSPSGPV